MQNVLEYDKFFILNSTHTIINCVVDCGERTFLSIRLKIIYLKAGSRQPATT